MEKLESLYVHINAYAKMIETYGKALEANYKKISNTYVGTAKQEAETAARQDFLKAQQEAYTKCTYKIKSVFEAVEAEIVNHATTVPNAEQKELIEVINSGKLSQNEATACYNKLKGNYQSQVLCIDALRKSGLDIEFVTFDGITQGLKQLHNRLIDLLQGYSTTVKPYEYFLFEVTGKQDLIDCDKMINAFLSGEPAYPGNSDDEPAIPESSDPEEPGSETKE